MDSAFSIDPSKVGRLLLGGAVAAAVATVGFGIYTSGTPQSRSQTVFLGTVQDIAPGCVVQDFSVNEGRYKVACPSDALTISTENMSRARENAIARAGSLTERTNREAYGVAGDAETFHYYAGQICTAGEDSSCASTYETGYQIWFPIQYQECRIRFGCHTEWDYSMSSFPVSHGTQAPEADSVAARFSAAYTNAVAQASQP